MFSTYKATTTYFKFSNNHSGSQTNNLRRLLNSNVAVRKMSYDVILKDYVKHWNDMGQMTKATNVGGTLLVLYDVGMSAQAVDTVLKSTGDVNTARKAVLKETLKIEGSLIGAWAGAGLIMAFGLGTGGLGFVLVGAAAVGSGVMFGIAGGVAGQNIADSINNQW